MARSWWHAYLHVLIQLFTLRMCASGCTSYTPLGVSSGTIPSNKISASTIYNSSNNLYHYGASQARLGVDSFWCGSDRASWREDWIQFDLDDLKNVTGVAVETGWQNNLYGILAEFYLQYSVDGAVFQNQTGANGQVILHKLQTINHRTEYFWFDAIFAKFIRIRASKLLITTIDSRFCGKFELFGCSSTKLLNELYTIGVARIAIPDSQITASSSIPGNPAYHARLNFPNSWCPTTNTNEWLQIDMGQALMVSGIATQGHYGRLSENMVSQYLISFANSSAGPFDYVQNGSGNRTLHGNNQTSEDPVFNLIESSLVARYVRIHPITGYNGWVTGKLCMRVEVYASHPVCGANLMSTAKTRFYTVNSDAASMVNSYVDIYSNTSWCSGMIASSRSPEETESLRIDLGSICLVTGIAMTGNPSSDSWVTTFDVSHGLLQNEIEASENAYVGPKSRVDVAVNWFKAPALTRYLQVKPKHFVGNRCLRIRALGCTNVPTISYIPRLLSITSGSDYITLKIEANGTQSIKAVFVKYFCPDAALTLPCSNEISSIVPKKYMKEDTFNITSLHPWTKYEIKLRYIFNSSQSYERNITNITTLETEPSQAPGKCNVTAVNATTILLSWDHLPINSSHGHIIGYRIVFREASINKNSTSIANSLITTYIISGLDSNTAYSIQIYAFNKAGSGPPCRLGIQTLPKASGDGSGNSMFAMKSATALISCSAAVMLIVISCILTKALYEKMRHRSRKKRSQRHMAMIKSKTLINFLELGGKKIDNANTFNSESLLRIVEAKRKNKGNLTPVPVGRSQYYKNLRLSAQSSASRNGSAKSFHNREAISQGEAESDEQMRKIGFDNSAFGSLGAS